LATTAKLHQFHQEFYDAKKKHEQKEKYNHATAAEFFMNIKKLPSTSITHITIWTFDWGLRWAILYGRC
jgi:hypothetical protein